MRNVIVALLVGLLVGFGVGYAFGFATGQDYQLDKNDRFRRMKLDQTDDLKAIHVPDISAPKWDNATHRLSVELPVGLIWK